VNINNFELSNTCYCKDNFGFRMYWNIGDTEICQTAR